MSSGLSRPSTASGSNFKRLGSFGSSSNEIPELSGNASSTLLHEINSDSLLRILTEGYTNESNAVIMMSEKGDAVGLKNLISLGINITKCKGLDGYSPLHHASSRGHGLAVAVIIKAGVDVNCRNNSEETALHLACYSGHLLVVEQLIDNGADIEARNSYGETPLFYAARRSMPAVARLLIQRGADMNANDQFDEKPIDHAIDPRTKLVLNTIHNIEIPNAFSYETLVKIFHYLDVKDIGRAACVAGKWHRVSETPIIWNSLGIRKWECALNSSLGFGMAPASLYKPKPMVPKPKSKDKNMNSSSTNMYTKEKMKPNSR